MSEAEIYQEMTNARYDIIESLEKYRKASEKLGFNIHSMCDDIMDCLHDGGFSEIECKVKVEEE